ncbi:hypothetical protein [Chromohalobacter moromii]|uniref:Uncharacterized protein n=1 Tax=Chromohalobacter moromii TaxID=2860329 RepID=A0A9X2X2H2_9GAMM|nr:hypothetical protein [Chromohalobacter moromii]MCK2046173.1 hypothetical protein [Chromohalobacter moromii]MCT8505403.1 hypothetical protein [Chromohalobacter moromii]
MAAMNTVEQRISRKKVAIEVASLLLSLAVAWFFQPWYHCSDNAIIVVVSVFSMLTGFLVAVMAIVANDRVMRGRNWRQDTFYLRQIKREMLRHKITFYIYLMVLVFAFCASVSGSWPSGAQQAAEHALLFFVSMGLLHSFQLPGVLSRKHITALEEQIRQRRDAETGKSSRSHGDDSKKP